MKKIVVSALCVLVFSMAMIAVAGAAEYLYYENDFSDLSTLEDFTQCRGEWGIVDGQLMLTGLGELQLGEEHGIILYTKDPAVMNLTDYIVDVDMLNVQTQAGVLFRCDITQDIGSTNNAFYGYYAFTSNNGEKAALGRADAVAGWAGNLKVSDSIFYPGANLHLNVVVEGTSITYTVTDKDSGAELWQHTEINDEWALGSFGFRACVMNSGLTNLNMVGFDNLKITATGEVGDHLAAGKALADYKPNVTSAAVEPLLTPAIEVTVPDVVEVSASDLDMTKTEYVFYENDFSDPSTIADFTQYRGKWVIQDGRLYYSELTPGFEASANFSFILYTANHDANLLTDYTIEADIYNSQSALGLISRADLAQACSDSGNAFYGYLSFISNNGQLGAVGYCNEVGAWGGNIKVSESLLTPGKNYHLKAVHSAETLVFTITDLETGAVVWEDTETVTFWQNGSFGFRSISTRDSLTNLNTVGIDNLKVTVYGDQAVLLNAGYHPNAKISGDTSVATEPVTSSAPDNTSGSDAVTTSAGADPTNTTGPVTSGTPDVSTAPDNTSGTDTVTTPAGADTTDASVPEDSKQIESSEKPNASSEDTATTPATTPSSTKDGNAPAEEDASSNTGLIIGIVAAVVVIAAVVVAIVVKKKKK